MDQRVILSSIPLDELKIIVKNIVTEAINHKAQEELSEKLLSPEATCKMFVPNISKVTLEAWSKKGYLNKKHIGGRTYYKYSEILESVKHLSKYKKPQI